MTYDLCKKVIEKGTYGPKEEMLIKLDVFLLNNRISTEEYTELKGIMDSKVVA